MKRHCSCIISKTKTQMQMQMQKSMHISVFIWFFRAPDEILGLLGPNPFWMSWRMAQKRISRKHPWKSRISEKNGGVGAWPFVGGCFCVAEMEKKLFALQKLHMDIDKFMSS